MSLRPVELQFALHKNDEVGLKQSQLNNKPTQDQTILANAAAKNTEKERQVTGKADDVNQSSIRDQEKEHAQRNKKKLKAPSTSSKNEEENSSGERRVHPFKGKHIDLSL
jgi:long-subunit fatty acid transport protein